MEKIPTSHTWVNFFQDAGIPDDLSAQYAVMFTDHRIHRDMLAELDREILSDIGVKAVGDKMAILKHARFISEQSKRDASSKELASGLKKPTKTSVASERPKAAERPNPSTVPVPKKKIKLITTAVSRTVDKSPRTEQGKDVLAVPKTEKRSVFQRLGVEGNSSVMLNRLGESSEENSEVQKKLTKSATPSILSRLGGEIKELPDSSTGASASQKRNIKKVVTLKKKTTDSMLQSTFDNVKKPSVLDRLGQKPNQNITSGKLEVVSKPNIALLAPKKNRNLIKIPSKHKQEVDPAKLVVTTKKPISSNAVSSTSAGLFRGAAESGSSVFDRLGPK